MAGRWVALAAILLLITAGCSNARADYLAAASSVCRHHIEGVADAFDEAADVTDLETLASAWDAIVTELEPFVSALTNLDPSADLQAAHDAYRDAHDELRVASTELRDAALAALPQTAYGADITTPDPAAAQAVVDASEEVGRINLDVQEAEAGLPVQDCHWASGGAEESMDEGPEDARRQAALDAGLSEEEWEVFHADVNAAVADIEGFWRVTLPTIYQAEYEAPDALIPYWSKQTAPKCGGQRAELGNAFYCFTDRTVAWDEPNLLIPYYQELGDFSIAFVLAHEWGHLIQGLVGARVKFTIEAELQADCYAGAWAADAKDRGVTEMGDLQEALFAVAEAGDLKGTPWWNEQAHGSARERRIAFLVGRKQGPKACTKYSKT